ncbi:RHS repeat-associated core domain-containing protein [Xenorhabdus vietnamensis]|uniref:RHS repeat-associated core domain-containing protein n=1 Tax=Xenorhabdus vietnamensis TaxID=351656 RepID=UPI001FCA218C|nr:RHS repeat-associated core domain-containing protein [Xenorhabdus vietnamensis]
MAKGAKDDSPTGTGNTLGTIVGQPKRAKRRPREANPHVKPSEEKPSFFDSLFGKGPSDLDRLGERATDSLFGKGPSDLDRLGERATDSLFGKGPSDFDRRGEENIRKIVDNMFGKGPSDFDRWGEENIRKIVDNIADWASEQGKNLAEAVKNPGEAIKGFGKGLFNSVIDLAQMIEKIPQAELALLGEGLKLVGANKVGELFSNFSQKYGDIVQGALGAMRMELRTPGEQGGALIGEVVSLFVGPGKVKTFIKVGSKFVAFVSKAAKGKGVVTDVLKAKKALNETKSIAKTEKGSRVKGEKKKDQSTNSKKSKEKEGKKENDSDNQSDQEHSSTCKGGSCGKGEPVDITSGDYLQTFSVISIPGLLPITLTRTYRSTACLNGLLGRKWADDWSRQLVVNGETVHFTDADGQIYDFSVPENQVLVRNRHLLHCLLTGELDGELCLLNKQNQQTFHFNHLDGNQRRLSAITDRHQNHIQFIYNDQHQLTEVIRNDGFRLTLRYQDHQLRTVDYHFQQIQQRLVTCHYDQHGYLAECDAFQQNHLWHEYTAQGFMTRWHDTDKTDFYIHYDERGRVISTHSSAGYWDDRFIYDDEARVTTYLDAEGGKTLSYYNQNNQVIREVDPLGREIRTQWRYNQKVWEIDPLGGYTTFDYNNDGALTEIILPTGEAFYYDYDEHGQLIEATLPTGDIWQFHHDKQGNLTAVTNPQGHQEEYQYGIHGELRQHLLPDGRQWHYAYDEHQRLAAVMTPDGQTTSLELDELGRLRRTTDALKQETRYRYSPVHASLDNGSLTEVELPDGVTQHMEYDSERRVIAVTDGEGRTTRYSYGAFDLLTHITRPDGTTLHFGYDRLTRFCSVTASTGETYRYERDAAGQIIREVDFTGRTIDYQYDALGRRIQASYPDNHSLRWHYSSAGLLTRQETWYQAGDKEELKSVTTYEYNARRQIIRAANDDAVVEYEYDAKGLPVCERINGREITREWNDFEQITAETIGEHTLRFGYNVMGAVNHFQFNQHTPLTLSHDALGREVVRESAEGFILASRYTSTGLLAHQSAGRATVLFRETLAQNDPHFPPQATAVNRSWQYDRAYSVRRIDDDIWGQTRYCYNQNDQIISATFNGRLPYEEQFRYDANGNLSQHVLVDAQGAIKQFEQYQQAGRVIKRGNVTYRYDDNGRQVEKTEHHDGFRLQVWRYRWDTQNQLTHCETPDGSRWHYRYDAFGRRIRKLKVHDGKLAAANLQRWLDGKPDLTAKPDTIMGYDYLWSGDQLVEEVPLYADGTPAYDRSIFWLYQPGALTLSARYEKGKLYYIVSDHQGTPREILSESGKLVWASRLTTWGKAERMPLLAANDEDYYVSCNLRFAGQYEDEESGLYYNRFRYYDCDVGQYLTFDPIGLLGGMNPYGYVHNPTRWIDPFGLVPCIDGNHVYKGDTGGGFHYRENGIDPPNAKVVDTPESIVRDGNGVYKANVEITGKDGISLHKESTFFPDNWREDQVRQAILQAFQNSGHSTTQGGRWLGKYNNTNPLMGKIVHDMEIRGYFNANNRGGIIKTAYPVFK